MSHDRFRRLADITPVALFETDLCGHVVYVNEAWCRMTGLSEADALGDGWVAALHSEDRDAVVRRWAECAASGSPFRMQFRYRRPGGTDVPADVQVTQVMGADGEGLSWLGAATDLTDPMALEGRIARTEERFRGIVELSTDVIYRIRTEPLHFDYLSPSVRTLTGWDADGFYANPLLLSTVVHPDDLSLVVAALDPNQRHSRVRLRLRHADGREVTVEAVGTPLLDDTGRKIGIQGALRDITAQALVEAELEILARQDPLTGLANRRVLFDQLNKRLCDDTVLTVALIDLDGFKQINDRHGHVAGDEVLVAVGDRLRAVLRTDDTIGRLAGDEFLVLSSHPEPARLADRLAGAFASPVLLTTDASIEVAASIGTARARAGEEALDVIRRADSAMYGAKKQCARRDGL